jgi:elongation factor 3
VCCGLTPRQQPHIIVMDEPTNYLDRDALGALAMAVKEFGGGVLLITHNCEFADALKEETWECPGDGTIYISGNKWGQGKKGQKEAVQWDGPEAGAHTRPLFSST